MLNKNFEELRVFCFNDKHHQILDALIKHNGHYHKAAIEIDTTVNTVASLLFRMRKMAAKQGTDPEGNLNFKTPAGFTVDRVSSFIDDEGAVKRQWVIANRDKSEQWEAFEEAVRNLAETVEGKAEPVAAPIYTKDELMVKYPLADMHLGLLTHAKEVESDFDLKIAKQIFTQAMEAVVNSSPNAHTALILDLGDTIHTDDSSNQTKASKHNLDVDGRFDKVFDTALMILITMIDYALTKHQQVIFRKTRGNHDPDMSIAISG